MIGLLQLAIDARLFQHEQRSWLRRWARRYRGRFVRSVYGPRMKVDFDDFTNLASIAGIFEGDYGDVAAAVATLQPGDAWIDVGANAGVFALAAALRVGDGGRVLAFEPNPRIFGDLVDNIRANRLENIAAFKAALGERTGSSGFWLGAAHHSGLGHLAEQGNSTVRLYRFDDPDTPFAGIVGPRRTVVKIDVEGAELRVIRSMREFLARPQVAAVIVEIDAPNMQRFADQPAALYATMAGLGFTPRLGLGARHHYNEFFERRG